MTPEIPNPDDRVTPWLLKRIFLPLFAGDALLMFLDVQINQWKCDREAKRQGYLEGNFIPKYQVQPRRMHLCKTNETRWNNRQISQISN
jgi:hypothetical protein